VYDATAGWVVVQESISLLPNKTAFHFFKMVFDSSTDKYVRVILDQYEIDISSLNVLNAVAAGNNNVGIGFINYGVEMIACTTYLDSALATVAEP
jgi:hypothetical protein